MNRCRFVWAFAALVFSVACAAQALRIVSLSVGMFRIQAEVADSQQARMTGLMHRKSMLAHEGMLFVFEAAGKQCFWMKNTLIPLSIAFLDDSGKIVNIADMAPETEESHCSEKPVRLALEMNQGWFKAKGIGPGRVIDGIAAPAAK